MTRKAILKREAVEYISKTDMTGAERKELLSWVENDNSVYENPWHMADENGCTMDYISAVRAANDYYQKNDLENDITECGEF